MTEKTCFVIMPFSRTKSTSQKNWTLIYEKIIKPAVNDAGLDFVCKRAKAVRGNVLKEIINDLNESDVIIADMTDHNPNVCYELGIRHGLNVGTILLAQKREFLNIFDLKNYASHVYSWKKRSGKIAMTAKIRELLLDYVQNPLKPDNPVRDYLQFSPSYFGASKNELKGVVEFDNSGNPQISIPAKHITGKQAVGFLLLAKGRNGLSLKELTKLISKSWKRQSQSDISAIIAQMSGWVIKEGERRNYIYRLNGTGRQEILRMISILKNS